MPFMRMDHADDPKESLKNKIGSLDGYELFNNQILVAVYIRPENLFQRVEKSISIWKIIFQGPEYQPKCTRNTRNSK